MRQSAAFTYNVPGPGTKRALRAVFGSWSIDGIFTARTSPPVNVSVDRGDVGTDPSLFNTRPDQVPGVSLYILPGGGESIPLRFSVPVEVRQGDLGRNALRGFPLTQLDFDFRRQFGITEKMNLQWRVDFFNLFNHPNFGSVDGDLGFWAPPLQPNPTFGVATNTLANTGGPYP